MLAGGTRSAPYAKDGGRRVGTADARAGGVADAVDAVQGVQGRAVAPDARDLLASRNRGVDDSSTAAADTSTMRMLADQIGGG